MKPTYAERLKDPRWQKKRLEILQRDQWKCRLCGDAQSTLHVHHLRYNRGAQPWEADDRSLATLCEICHESLHVYNFTGAIVEALIAAGAPLRALWAIRLSFEALIEGRDTPLTDEQWRGIEKAVGDAVRPLCVVPFSEAIDIAFNRSCPKDRSDA